MPSLTVMSGTAAELSGARKAAAELMPSKGTLNVSGDWLRLGK